MAKQLYWSIAGGASSSSPPTGLECINTADSVLVVYLSDPDDPDAVLVDDAHDDVLLTTTVRGRLVAAALVKLLDATYNSATQVWQLHLEYHDDLATDAINGLDACQIVQAQCFTPETQAKLVEMQEGVVDPDWITSLEAFLDTRVLDAGGLPTIPS